MPAPRPRAEPDTLSPMPNRLHYGDNLQILRAQIQAKSVDLIYLDPPFNSQATYNVLFKGPTGERSKAQIEACLGRGVGCVTGLVGPWIRAKPRVTYAAATDAVK